MRLCPVIFTSALLAAGCGGAGDDRVQVTGKIVDAGKAFTLDVSKIKLPPGATSLPPGSNPLQVVFISSDGQGTHPAEANASDGTFKVRGADGKGLKPGKYKVAVTGGVGGADYFGGKFTPDKTQIVKDVQAGQEVVIDVSKPQG